MLFLRVFSYTFQDYILTLHYLFSIKIWYIYEQIRKKL